MDNEKNLKDEFKKAHILIDKNGYNVTNNAYKMKNLYEQYLLDSKKVR